MEKESAQAGSSLLTGSRHGKFSPSTHSLRWLLTKTHRCFSTCLLKVLGMMHLLPNATLNTDKPFVPVRPWRHSSLVEGPLSRAMASGKDVSLELLGAREYSKNKRSRFQEPRAGSAKRRRNGSISARREWFGP